MNDRETEYYKLPNRCPDPDCAHRKEMHAKGKGCLVVMGTGKPGQDHDCKCRRSFG